MIKWAEQIRGLELQHWKESEGIERMPRSSQRRKQERQQQKQQQRGARAFAFRAHDEDDDDDSSDDGGGAQWAHAHAYSGSGSNVNVRSMVFKRLGICNTWLLHVGMFAYLSLLMKVHDEAMALMTMLCDV